MSAGVVQSEEYRNNQKRKDGFISIFIGIFAFVWIFPILWTVFTSLRPYNDVISYGIFSWPRHINFNNYVNAVKEMHIGIYLTNSLIVTVPSVILTLFFGSLIAFVVTRYQFKFNLWLLLLFTAGNMLPIVLTYIPVFWMFLWVGDQLGNRNLLYNNYAGLILVHVGFQVGFATFVLSSYMKTIPKEISESAKIDGANVFRHYWNVILPLLRPALAALSVLMSTWIYNEFFWALVLMSDDSKRPITSALRRLQGQYVTDFNLLAAGAIIAASPTVILFFVLRKQFIAGLTLGSTKG
jgi:multiple sugar transport system permease protein